MRRFAVIRADAGPGIGGGHVIRSISLAGALTRRGWHCVFVSRLGSRRSVAGIANWPNWHELPDDALQPGPLGRRFAGESDTLLIVDSYALSAAFEHESRDWARRIFVIDDLANRPHDCDFLLDSTLGRTAASYRSLVPPHCELLLGPRYAPLRLEFAAMRTEFLARRRGKAAVGRILISLGAGDVRAASLAILDGIAASGFHPHIDVVGGGIGPEDISAYAFPIAPAGAVANIAELMLKADLAIGATGSASWERCCLGLPSLTVVLADNQREIAAVLGRRGATTVLGDVGDITPETIGAALRRLGREPELLRGMSDAAAEICDGGGADRIADAIEADWTEPRP